MTYGSVRILLAICLLFALAYPAAPAQKKKKKGSTGDGLPTVELDPEAAKGKKKKEVMQVLPPSLEPPAAITADADKLSFSVSPLSAKGLLSQQTKDALKAILNDNRGATIVQIRGFVSGSGDLRRVKELVAEVFTDRRLPLPVITTVQVGALPLNGAQVVLEAAAIEKKPVNENGLAFISGQSGKIGEPLASLTAALEKHQIEPGTVRRVTCYLSQLDTSSQIRSQVSSKFPKAAFNYMQYQRGAFGDFAECEAIAEPHTKPEAVAYLGPIENRYSEVAVVPPGTLVFTTMQMGFGSREQDAELAFERLQKALESVNSGLPQVVMSSVYPVSNAAVEVVRKVRLRHFSPKLPPASTMVPFEGLPSLDASFGIDVIAAVAP